MRKSTFSDVRCLLRYVRASFGNRAYMSTSSSLFARSPISSSTWEYVVVTSEPGAISGGSISELPTTFATMSLSMRPGALP